MKYGHQILKPFLFALSLSIPNAFAVDNTPLEPKVKANSKMIFVEGSCFNMGYAKGEADEMPVHKVCLSSFLIDQHEVTQAEFMGGMGYNPSKFQTCGFPCPVEQVTWTEAAEFCKRQDKRLLTEAEWEFAAQGGAKTKNYHFIGANTPDSVAWYAGASTASTQPVCQKHPNELGLCDMGGNVWEWVQDWYGPYTAEEKKNPMRAEPYYQADSMIYKVNKGGSFYGDKDLTRPAYRGWDPVEQHKNNVGFRCAKDTVIAPKK